MNQTKSEQLSKRVYEELVSMPGGGNIKECIQCGTCSGSCPVAHAMDYFPRRIIAMLRAGKIEEVLKSDTIWLCASCYSCTVRCPAGVKYTDFMYHLKRTGEKEGLIPKNKKGLKMAKNFNKVISEWGRSYEPELMVRYNIPNIFNLIKVMPFGLKLFLKGRMPFFPSKIKGAKHIKKALAAAAKEASK
ncbi:MAG TPA: heterodisulfide reductase subunit C [bacterium]|nr:heterodisulfide reductase subunit C [bacterium]